MTSEAVEPGGESEAEGDLCVAIIPETDEVAPATVAAVHEALMRSRASAEAGGNTRALSAVRIIARSVQPPMGFAPIRQTDLGGEARVVLYRRGSDTLAQVPRGGGRALLAAAARSLAARGDPISAEDLSAALEALAGPAPDLILLCRGVTRLAGAFTFDAAYAEFIRLETNFADLREAEFIAALTTFRQRSRRFGGLNPEAV